MSGGNPRLKFYEIIKTFKEQITTLLRDPSIQICEAERTRHIKKFDRIYDKIMMAKSTNSRLAIELFYNHLFVPYGEQIMSQNDLFFLQNRHELMERMGDNDMGLGDLVESISQMWPQLDNNNKKIIWRYILALCKVADIVVGENRFEQLKNKVNSV